MVPTFSNPRRQAQFDNWPFGSQTCVCKFEVEVNKKGERCLRTTSNKTGGWNKPKATTYASKTVIVDGSDGKTYLLQLSPHYEQITVLRSDFMHEGTAFQDGDPETYKHYLALINEAK